MQAPLSPLLSVIIPIYNVEPFLKECLDSVVNQTYQNLEIILVNDGSKDASAEICKEHLAKDERIQYYEQEHQGQSVARNLALSKATGEYITFVDSDDWIGLDIYEKCFQEIELVAPEERAITFWEFLTKQVYIEEPEKDFIFYPIKEKKSISPQHLFKSFILGVTYPVVTNKIFPATLLKDIQFIEGKYYEDQAFLFEALVKTNKIIMLPYVAYFYRKNPNSTIGLEKNAKLRRKDLLDNLQTLINEKRLSISWLNTYRIHYILYMYSTKEIISDKYPFLMEHIRKSKEYPLSDFLSTKKKFTFKFLSYYPRIYFKIRTFLEFIRKLK